MLRSINERGMGHRGSSVTGTETLRKAEGLQPPIPNVPVCLNKAYVKTESAIYIYNLYSNCLSQMLTLATLKTK